MCHNLIILCLLCCIYFQFYMCVYGFVCVQAHVREWVCMCVTKRMEWQTSIKWPNEMYFIYSFQAGPSRIVDWTVPSTSPWTSRWSQGLVWKQRIWNGLQFTRTSQEYICWFLSAFLHFYLLYAGLSLSSCVCPCVFSGDHAQDKNVLRKPVNKKKSCLI